MVRGIFCLRERGGGDEAGQSGEKPGRSERTGRSEAGAERSRGRAEKNRGGAKEPGQSEAGAERKNRAEEAEADAAADEKTSGRDTMPGRMFRYLKEPNLPVFQPFAIT